jgi:redox-sensitive bicupin YhaK (pirin superfamily)
MVAHGAARERHGYLFVISGALELNGQAMAAGDQARIADEPTLEIRASAVSHLMLLDLP